MVTRKRRRGTPYNANRIRNVETVNEEVLAAFTGVEPSKEAAGNPGFQQKKTEGSPVKGYVRPAVREEPIEAKKLDLLGSINFDRLVKRARPFRGLSEDIPEDALIIEETTKRYKEKVRALQLEVAGKIRHISRREADTYVDHEWGKLMVELSNERRDRERRTAKTKLESEGKIVILEEEKDWTHRDRIAEQGNVVSKCLNECPKPTVMITRSGKVEEICGFGGCWTQTREDLKAEEARKAEEGTRKIREARDILIKGGEAGDVYWLRWLLFLVSLNGDTRPGYLDRYNLNNRWKPIVGMTDGQVVGQLLALVANYLCRLRREGDDVDFLQVLNSISSHHEGIERDLLLWEPESLKDVELEVQAPLGRDD